MQQQKILAELNQRLSLPDERLEEGIDRLDASLEEAEDKMHKTAEAIWAEKVPQDGKRVILLRLPVFNDHFAKLSVKARREGLLLVLLPNGRFFLSEDEEDAFALKLLREKFSAKGGGPAQMSQGMIPDADPEAVAEALGADYYVL